MVKMIQHKAHPSAVLALETTTECVIHIAREKSYPSFKLGLRVNKRRESLGFVSTVFLTSFKWILSSEKGASTPGRTLKRARYALKQQFEL